MFDGFQYIGETARGTGAVVALAVVCLVQYVYHTFRLRTVVRTSDLMTAELAQLEVEVESLQDERLLARVENEFLREFVSQTDLAKAVDVVLRRLVAHPSEEFAVLLLYRTGRLQPHRSRGLSLRTTHVLTLDAKVERTVLADGALVVDGRSLSRCTFLAPMTSEERGRARQLVFLRVGNEEDPVGILVTTTLFPPGADREKQLVLGRRLMESVAGNIQWARTLESREDELKLTTEMLELRAITDRSFPTPLAMIERFLDGLRRIVGAERIALFLATRDTSEPPKAIVRAGIAHGQGVEGCYREHEARLAEYGFLGNEEPTEIDDETLQQIGVDSLVREAHIAPVVRDAMAMGVVVFTSRQWLFDRSRTSLVAWACGQLARTLDRVLNQANAELRARQDPLTELANRGEFDNRIVGEVERATANDSSATPVALLLIDLDHFKQVNDTYGHRGGDEVLRVTARGLRKTVGQIRSGDRAVVARYGGEELAVLLPGMGLAGARRIAEELRSRIERQIVPHDDTVITVTASIGVATCPDSANDVEGLVGAADAALYRAKHLGRNRVVLATPSSVSRSVSLSVPEAVETAPPTG